MPGADLDDLVRDLRAVAAAAVPQGSLDYGVLCGGRDHLERTFLVVAYRNSTNEAVAFNAMVRLSAQAAGRTIEVLHVGLALVDPDCRKQGLSWLCCGLASGVALVRNLFRPLWSSNVTQVPAAFGMFSKRLANVFPGRPDASATPVHRDIARALMADHSAFGVGEDAVFDEERFVIRNAYTGGSDHLKKSFESTAKHRDAQYNERCMAELDYARGDDFLQVGQLTVSAVARCWFRSLARFSILPRISRVRASLALEGAIRAIRSGRPRRAQNHG